MKALQILFPSKGNSDSHSFTEQPPLTSLEMLNVRGVDPRSGRLRGSRRAALQKYCTTALNTGVKVKDIFQVTHDVTRISWAAIAAGSEETRWSTVTPTKTDTLGGVADRQANLYVLDGPSGIAKYNADGLLLFKHPLPIAHKDHVCRALWIDDFDHLYAAVSTGGDQTTAKAWCYLLGENASMPLELLWELTPGAFIERMKLRGDKLYTLQNRPDRGKTDVVAYTNIDTSDPVEAFRRPELPFPGNDFDLGPDGSIFLASEPNATRGFDPKVPDSTPGGQDWTPKELANFDRRVWSWHDASDPDAFAVTRLTGADEDEGGTIETWYDKSGKSRHWYASSVAGEKGPTVRTIGIGGYRSLHFNGSNQAMESALPTSTEKSQKADQLTTIPNYSGAQFALFIVFRAPVEAVVRWLVGFDGGTDRAIMVNREPGAALPGVAVAGSLSLFEEGCVAGTAAASVTVPAAPTGGRPSPGSVGSNGFTVVTWICDGGVHDVFSTATRSTLRINGAPSDRWQSAEFSSAAAARLGKAAASGALSWFSGDVVEMFCLSDWEDANNVSQRLLTVPEYPDTNFAPGGDSECERIEGYLANKPRGADQLPGGRASVLTLTGNAVAGNTVTIGIKTYTFVAAPAVANDVDIGLTTAESLSNLRHANNRTGRAGIDYHASTIANADARALSPMLSNNAADYRMMVVNRNPNGAALATTSVLAAGAWNAATTSTTINAAPLGSNNGFYPHPFYYKRTGATLSVGGPPRAAGAAAISKVLLLNSVYGILAKIDASNGVVKWIATSDFDGVGSGIGAVGYGVLITSDGQVYSIGPRQAAVAGPPAILADLLDVRKLVDTGTAFSTSTGTVAGPWSDDPGEPTYHYPRMAIDRFDNLYVPIFNAAANISAIVYSKDGTGTVAADCAVELVTLNNLTNDPQSHAIAVDPTTPTYQTAGNPLRAEHFFLLTRNAGVLTVPTAYKIRLVNSTLAAGSNRAHVNVGVCGADVQTFAAPATVGSITGGTGAVDSGARYIDSTRLFGKGYLVDGKKTLVFDPIANTVGELTADSAGPVPQFCKIIATYGGRLVLVRDPSNPQNFHMSAKDKPRNWDLFPRVPTADQALSGNVTDGTGKAPDIINSFASLADDLAIIGCDHSIHRITGNPTLLGRGRIDMVSKTIGMSWGKSWARDPEGGFYFFGSRGGVWMLPLGGVPIPLSENTIHKRLSEIDLENYYMRLVWSDDPAQQGLFILQFPFGAGGTHVKHWFIERRTGGWLEDEYGSSTMTSVQPTAAYVIDGDSVDDRLLLFGCEDGFLRYFDPYGANGDDGQAIESRVMMGPYHIDEAELRFERLQATFANDQAGCRYELFASDEPDVPGSPVVSGDFEPGINPIHFVKARGKYLWVRLQIATAGEPWSMESIHMTPYRAGRARVRMG